MKDETFDELLKRRIESHEMPFSSNDIDRVHQHVQRNLPVANTLSSFRKTAVNYTVGGLLAVGSVIGVNQYFQNKELTDKVQKIENQLKKYESQLQNQQALNSESEKVTKANLTQPEQIKLNASNSNIQSAVASIIDLSKKQKVKSNGAHNAFLANVIPNSHAGNVPQNLQTLQNNSKDLFAVNATKNAETAINEAKSELQNGSVSLVSQPNEIQVDTVERLVVLVPEKMANLAKPTKDTAAISDSIKEVKLMLPKLNYGIGIAGNIGMEERGLGFVFSVVKNKRWQFQSGLRMSQYQGKMYEDAEDFWRAEKVSFASTYGGFKSGVHIKDIQNIQFKYSALHVPISVSYLMPMKNDFSFIVGLGTDFSLRTKENITYKARIEPGNIIMNHEMDLIRTSTFKFENAVFTMGVQKLWKGFAFQSMMYFDKKFGDVDYRQMPMSAGLKVQILYYLRK